jgi:uncharacterized protein (TIGR00255 family)
MTSYGKGEASEGGCDAVCEIRTLNSRFIEVNVRMPRCLVSLENEITNLVKSTLGRGKVDLFIDLPKSAGSQGLPEINRSAVEHYLKIFAEVQGLAMREGGQGSTALATPTITDFLGLEGVLVNEGANRISDRMDAQGAAVLKAVKAALDEVIKFRVREGEALADALRGLLAEIAVSRVAIESRVSEIRQWVQDAYTKRLSRVIEDLKKLGSDVARPPEDRLAVELTILTEKADVEEELTRLKTHEREFQACLDSGDGVGRKLDFLCQELHREVNTISSKIQNSDITEHAILLKQAIERIRQQVQNIE